MHRLLHSEDLFYVVWALEVKYIGLLNIDRIHLNNNNFRTAPKMLQNYGCDLNW